MPRYLRGVVMYNMHPEVHRVLEGEDRILDQIFLEVAGRLAIVTSARDGEHRQNSWHYYGRAFDLRNRDLTDEQKIQAYDLMREKLGSEFRVLPESTHFHISYADTY